jgi:hypothetical protein
VKGEAMLFAFDRRNELTRIDEKEPEEIERRREHMRKGD